MQDISNITTHFRSFISMFNIISSLPDMPKNKKWYDDKTYLKISANSFWGKLMADKQINVLCIWKLEIENRSKITPKCSYERGITKKMCISFYLHSTVENIDGNSIPLWINKESQGRILQWSLHKKIEIYFIYKDVD